MPYNRNVLENPNVRTLTDEQHQFVEDMGQTMVGWGLPRATGRVYGCLLLQAEPASLDDIADALGVGKSGISVATRQLVQFGMARVVGERGSRRLRYEALYTLEGILAARQALLLELLARLRQGAEVSSQGARRDRLVEMADTVQRFADAAPALIAQLREGSRS